jgi:hypothetical protein
MSFKDSLLKLNLPLPALLNNVSTADLHPNVFDKLKSPDSEINELLGKFTLTSDAKMQIHNLIKNHRKSKSSNDEPVLNIKSLNDTEIEISMIDYFEYKISDCEIAQSFNFYISTEIFDHLFNQQYEMTVMKGENVEVIAVKPQNSEFDIDMMFSAQLSV